MNEGANGEISNHDEVEAWLTAIQPVVSGDKVDLVSEFRAAFKRAQPVIELGEAVVNAMRKLSGSTLSSKEFQDRALQGVRVTSGEGVEYTARMSNGRLGHGPLEPIFPGHCHATIWICNPLPIGPQLCLEISIPWWCEPGDEPGADKGDIIIL